MIVLTITDSIVFDRPLSRYRFKDVEDFVDYSDDEIDLVFVELPKFNKTLEELETLSDAMFAFEAIEDLQQWLGQN